MTTFYKILQSTTVQNNAEKQEHTQLSDLDHSESSKSLDDFMSLKASASYRSNRNLNESLDRSAIRSRQSSFHSGAMIQQLQNIRSAKTLGQQSQSPVNNKIRGLVRFPSFD